MELQFSCLDNPRHDSGSEHSQEVGEVFATCIREYHQHPATELAYLYSHHQIDVHNWRGPPDPVLDKIRDIIHKHRILSPYHWLIRYHVWGATKANYQEALHGEQYGTAKSYVFADGTTKHVLFCRAVTQDDGAIYDVLIRYNSEWVSLVDWLSRNYRAFRQMALPLPIMHNWWAGNGQFFPFELLPTELQLKVVKHCMFQPTEYLDAVSSHRRRTSNPKDTQPWEMYQALGDYKGLYRVSMGVRSVTLKAVFDHLAFHLSSPAKLANCLRRMDKFRLLVSALTRTTLDDSDECSINSDIYRQSPRDSPQLDHFGTLMHKIRKLILAFDVKGFLEFLQWNHGHVSWGDSSTLRPPFLINLPYLKEIELVMPSKTKMERDPWFWHEKSPCPRQLHRWILDAASEALKDLKAQRGFKLIVSGAMTQNERLAFHESEEIRKRIEREEKKRLELLDAIEEDVTGGLILEDLTDGGAALADKDTISDDDIDEACEVYPPRCTCEPSCMESWDT
ncbi:hypothetical protein K432DRAFT_377902 [Lepidopterella palustris CBS 459.81]|uniref:Uncharacterized protein n=1 Tax=Lepidopterella palustris CBS 459.81 TaxID=1314670 RepID=A0A8E2EJJ3_9PEZI|nr:hypothetical protein K432DRAFT_377902 [Lepidopterella palustris CBS 459.81]